ncbi:hypothetical protein OrNV_gp093 [Oryctes rhinoceros nudivirus]|uniref:Uncharacterized protein n=1 Tax=Oryctes rhinoceros nudivirus TaxID=92521 RepID=A0A6B9QQW7_9VIRU|nr:hypothetical protein OrNV_gp093 [Oryctes rhinoceros nudivirus]ACH96223.1 unknown [Oryctes rhinoceros nudivirus]QHG11325.1 hypothetical protein SI_OrNV_gp093 [Oryctes rhinoceros nudivirus]QKE59556.1 hypothetical protein SI_OrNV_gp093 [Oryctes rhinoceros nudivirus]UBO76503.1 hypothetical protein SI_OrNV_gp093 [Oryctes rhinoceros nudivirus]UBR58401.1 hypothetical protein [Oryctes rhinoceros nudivirus]
MPNRQASRIPRPTSHRRPRIKSSYMRNYYTYTRTRMPQAYASRMPKPTSHRYSLVYARSLYIYVD